EGGVTRVSISDKGVLVELEGSPVYAAAEAAPNRMVLVFRPGLQAVETTPAGWKLSYSGDLRPVLRQEGAQVIIDLPGAVTGKQGLPVETVGPEAGPAAQPANSPTAQVPTRMPAGGLRLKLPAMDGQPFALYRTAPGTLELRFLSPGLAGKAIVIDPGHGDEETGAVGPGGSAEKDVNLAVALKLRPLLEQAGAKVIMTRAEDRRVASDEALAAATSEAERTQIDLAARSALADQAGADLFLSIHSNGGEEGEGGTETYWATSNLNASLSRTLALLAQEELVEALGLYDRGAKQRAFNVIRMSDAPATLVELGFMTEPDEESLLLSAWGQEAAARALFRALERYFTP
ncbi:MAG TPA: N-acetylmuramoyl-L-alanine amidase, partial [Symbiobacteriaceae bacterium]|nr:N-acetylmuramoyl-L-alanine amidase [Symbiobacteriaceae bacterium]